MKRKYIFLLLLGLSFSFLFSEVDTVWTKTYGGPESEYCRDCILTQDGGYAMVGYTSQYGSSEYDVLLIKTNINGDTLWTKTYGGINNDVGRRILQTDDNGYVVIGYTNSYGMGNDDVWLIKTNIYGDTLWTKTYGGVDSDRGYAISQTQDNGFIIAGYTNSFGAGNKDVWLIKTDSNGDTLWTKTYGGENSDDAYALIMTSNGGYALIADTQSYGLGTTNIWFIRTDANGDTLWTKIFGGTGKNYTSEALIQTEDGGYAIAGFKDPSGGLYYNIWLIKTNANGDTIWTKTYGDDESIDQGRRIIQTSDKGYAIVGHKYPLNISDRDIWLIKTDNLGDILWTSTLGGDNSDGAYSIFQSQDNGFIIAGYTNSYGFGNYDFYLLKTMDIPETPKNISAIGGNDKITISWDERIDTTVNQYNIYRRKSSTEIILIDSISGDPPLNYYVDNDATNGELYYYRIKAVNNLGTEGHFSEEVSALPNLPLVVNLSSTGSIEGGVTILGDNTLYAPSSGDKVYRFDTTGTVMYSLNVNGNIKSSTTITPDHSVYIASTDYNLYSFNANGVSNSGWPKALGAEATASVAIDNSGNSYIGTSNGIYQCIAPSGDVNWSFNVGGAVYASSAISADNTLYVVNENGRVYAFDLKTLNPSAITPKWTYEIGDPVSSSPALDLDNSIYITTEGGEIEKLHDNGTSVISVWTIDTGQKYTSSPIISSDSTLYIGGEAHVLYAINTANGNIKWQKNLGSKINSTATLAEKGTIEDRLYLGTQAGKLYAINIDTDEIIWQYQADTAINCPILCANDVVYFGTMGGDIISIEDKFDNNALTKKTSEEIATIWPTFQGNNRRTGNQVDLNTSVSTVPEDYMLEQNYPNPFNPHTKIRYSLPSTVNVKLYVFDITGRKVKEWSISNQQSGSHEVMWDGTNTHGNIVSTGVYIYSLRAGDFIDSKKMVFMK